MDKFICIHAHFYQPPRENPWLDAVESQESARPFHDWNERVTAECYAPNAVARILDEKGFIREIVNNYEKISFDIGPTLISWLARNAPEVHDAIVEADRRGARLNGGRGPAMAQAYSHMIMPLASSRDKRTQIIWGIEDFKYRFKRMPEGMWMPETAVDIETLDIMAECGIKFTVLAPHQAGKVREPGGKWEELSGPSIDPKMPYLCVLPSGRSIAIFFYDSPVSRAVAFEGLLDSGEAFAHRLENGLTANGNSSALFHIATDGESYGHHHMFGEMALAYAIRHIEAKGASKITNYARYLSLHPPTREAGIIENTSWSCVHGIERWRSDCGCSTGAPEGWNQKWRGPLREALDFLGEALAVRFEAMGAEIFKDPWSARNGYIEVVLDRAKADDFLDRHSLRPLNPAGKVRALKMLEMARNSMLMYTSCGWFFADISGIETVQILLYAGRAVGLCRELGDDSISSKSIEREFLRLLSGAKSNKPSEGTGADIYARALRASTASPERICAHYAIRSLFENPQPESRVYSYKVKSLEHSVSGTANARLAFGACEVRSEITGEEDRLSYAALGLGVHDITCCAGSYEDDSARRAFASELSSLFAKGDFHGALNIMDRHFNGKRYFMSEMFRDGREEIINAILSESVLESADIEAFKRNRALLEMLLDMGLPIPKRFLDASESALSSELFKEIQSEFDAGRTREILGEFKKFGLKPDEKAVEMRIRRKLEAGMRHLESAAGDISAIEPVLKILETTKALPFVVNTWEAQNSYHRLALSFYPSMALRPDAEAKQWAEAFAALGDALNFSPEILGNTGADASDSA